MRSKVKKLVISLLVSASILLCAMVSQAAELQGVDIYPLSKLKAGTMATGGFSPASGERQYRDSRRDRRPVRREHRAGEVARGVAPALGEKHQAASCARGLGRT